jgi:hypothetical protein
MKDERPGPAGIGACRRSTLMPQSEPSSSSLSSVESRDPESSYTTSAAPNDVDDHRPVRAATPPAATLGVETGEYSTPSSRSSGQQLSTDTRRAVKLLYIRVYDKDPFCVVTNSKVFECLKLAHVIARKSSPDEVRCNTLYFVNPLMVY